MAEKQELTHVLRLQLPGVPEGYFPAGSMTQLKTVFDAHQGAARQAGKVELYELLSKPFSEDADFYLDALADVAKKVLDGEVDINISTKDARKQVEDVRAPVEGAFKALGGLLSTAIQKRGKVDVMDALPVLMKGQLALAKVLEAKDGTLEAFRKAVIYRQTPDFMVSEQGVFVSKAWVDNEANARRQMTFKVKALPAPETKI